MSPRRAARPVRTRRKKGKMTRKFCDRCDTQTDDLVLLQVPSGGQGRLPRNVELCRRCVCALHEFVQSLPKLASLAKTSRRPVKMAQDARTARG